MADKGLFNGIVCGNKPIGQRFYRFGLAFQGSAAEAFAEARPGQFAQLDVSDIALPCVEKIPADLRDAAGRKILLRRPFSFCDVRSEGGRVIVEIVFCVVGPATLRMTTLGEGDSVSVIGPLGNGFSVEAEKKIAVLVAGGMGMPPLQHLAGMLADDFSDIKVTVLAGAKSKDELPFEADDFAKCEEMIVTTDDGSHGEAGFVTDCFLQWLDKNDFSAEDMIIYSCGPPAMLAKIAAIAAERRIDCQISMERRMACGIGLCQSCAVECEGEGAKEKVYKMCCKDGPVFDSREIVF